MSGFSLELTSTDSSKTCQKCENGYFSVGGQTLCQKCSFQKRFEASTFAEKNAIDLLCFKDNKLVQNYRTLSDAEQRFIVFASILVGIVLIALGLYIFAKMCRLGKTFFAPRRVSLDDLNIEKERSSLKNLCNGENEANPFDFDSNSSLRQDKSGS